MRIFAILCTLLFLGSVFNLRTGIGDEAAKADLGAAWIIAVQMGALAIWAWVLFGYRKSKEAHRAAFFIAGSVAIVIAAVPLSIVANDIPRTAMKLAYGSTDLTLTGDLGGTHRTFENSSLIDQWGIAPTARLQNEKRWATSVSLYVDSPWASRNFVIDLTLSDGRVVQCAMTSGYIHSADVVSAHCDDMILFKDMGGVQSAVVHVDVAGK